MFEHHFWGLDKRAYGERGEERGRGRKVRKEKEGGRERKRGGGEGGGREGWGKKEIKTWVCLVFLLPF